MEHTNPQEDRHKNRETKPVFGGHEIDKVSAYDWIVLDKPGVFMWIPKSLLHIDPVYQRMRISRPRVLQIASRWSWIACGTLLIARRPDGSFFIIDGQHRKLAADNRSDISELPCLIFETEGSKEEARGFHTIHTVRTPMRPYQRYRARLAAEDPSAVGVEEMVTASGYKVSENDGAFQVICPQALLSAYEKSSAEAKSAWEVCVDIYKGATVHSHIYSALVNLESHLKRHRLPPLTTPSYRDRLVRTGPDALNLKANAAIAYYGKGGIRVVTQALIDVINKGRREESRIPDTGVKAADNG